MGNHLKIKKRKITIILLLIFNQLIISANALENRKTKLSESSKSNYHKKHIRVLSDKLISSQNKKQINNLKQETEEIEKFVEETLDPNDLNKLKNQQNDIPVINPDQSVKDDINKDIKNKKTLKEEKNLTEKSQNKNLIPNLNTSKESPVVTTE